MIERYKDEHVTWVDLIAPTNDEIRAVMEEYEIPPQLVGDLSGPVPRSEATSAEHAIKVTIDFPVVKRKDVEGAHEIKFIITKKTLLTVRYEDIAALHKFAKEFEVLSMLRKTGKEVDGGYLFFALMSTLYDGLAQKLDYLESRLNYIEQGMFEEREREMVFEISKTSQTLITFRQIFHAHKEVFEVARPMLIDMFSNTYGSRIEELVLHYQYLARRVSTLSASLLELRDTNNSLLETKQNEIMKIFTILAFVTFPLTLISSIFGMNTINMPIVGGQNDFWVVVCLMLAAGFIMFAYFRYKRWL